MQTAPARCLCACVLLTLIGSQAACRPSSVETAAPPKPPDVTISQVVERSLVDHEEFTGRLQAVESVEVRSRVRGYLNAVHFKDGQEVTAGTPLFEIDPRPFEAELKNAEGQKAQWAAKRDKASADVARYERLVPTGAASAQDLDKARAEQAEAVAAMQSADAEIERARLDLEFSKIAAPIDGQVGRALITKGNLIQAAPGQDALLTSIVSLNPIYVYFSVNERSLLRFRERSRAAMPPDATQRSVDELKIPVRIGLATEDSFPHEGVIDYADPSIDPSTGSVQVRARLDNAKRIYKPGLFARVRVPVSEPHNALLVSQVALGTDLGRKFVMVVDDKSVVEQRFVKTGAIQDDGLQVISDGLRPGEWIIVNGMQRARDKKPVTPQRVEMPTLLIGGGSEATSRPVAPPSGGGH